MSNLWELRVWLSVDESSLRSSTLRIQNEFKKAWDSIEKNLSSSWKKWMKDLKNESEKATKTIWWLNLKLKKLNDELNDTKIGSKRFKELQKEVKKTEKELWKVTNKTSKLWWVFKWMWGIIASTFGIYAIWNFIKSISILWAEVEQAKISFETLLWSEQKALQMLQDIDELASQTPFNKLGLTKSVQQLIWFWFEWEKALATIKVLGDSISAVGRWQADLNWVILALWQIEAKWKLSTEEVLQMAERGLPIFKVLEEQLWLTKKQLWDLWNQWIDSSTAINAILTGLNEKFAWSMEKQSRTLTWMWSNLVDNVEIAWSKMWLNIADSLKWIIGSINNFLQDNMYSIIDFWSDIATNVINIWKAIAQIFIDVFEIITDAFWILTWENKKHVNDNFKLFKYLAMALSNGFQVVYMVINTVLWAIFGAIKTLWTWLGNFWWSALNLVQLAWKKSINFVIWIINSAISKINIVLSLLGRNTIDQIKEVNTKMEELVLKNWNWLKNTKKAWTDSWDKIKNNNWKAFDRMLENIDNYETDITNTWKTSTWVFDRINTTVEWLWSSFEKVWWKAKDMWKKWAEATNEIKDSMKDLEDEYRDYNNKIKESEKLNESLAKNTKKYNNEIENGLRKVNKALDNNKKKYEETIKLIKKEREERLGENENSSQEQIAERLLEIEKEKLEIQLKIKEDTDSVEEKILLQKELNVLIKEELQAQEIVDQKVLERVKKYEEASEIWKILIDQEREKQNIISEANTKEFNAEKELNTEKETLERKQQFYEFFAEKKRITQSEIDTIIKDERFLRLSEEEQEFILKLAREKEELTRQKDEAIALQIEINKVTIELSNKTTSLLNKNVASLSSSYKSLISQINSAIIAQKRLNALKNSSSNGFADWGYTWDWAKHEVAWVVHKWEYVLNQEMIKQMPSIVPELESIRHWRTTNNDYSKKVDVWNINVANSIDLELFFDKLKFRM